MSHTPAPWVYCAKSRRVTAENGDQLIADIRSWGLLHLTNHKQIQNANGRLVAAAPELLAALERVVSQFAIYYSKGEGHPLILSEYNHQFVKDAIDLIARIKGRE
jgi:hypothetical protein